MPLMIRNKVLLPLPLLPTNIQRPGLDIEKLHLSKVFFPADQETAETFGPVNTLKVRQEGSQRITTLGPLPDPVALDNLNKTALLRPECIALEPAPNATADSHGIVRTIEPEGGTTLISVQLSQGPMVQARCLAPGSRALSHMCA